MKALALRTHYRMAWWWHLYKFGVLSAALLTGATLDPKKAQWWAEKAVKRRIELVTVDLPDHDPADASKHAG